VLLEIIKEKFIKEENKKESMLVFTPSGRVGQVCWREVVQLFPLLSFW
jgi:hypothetical protein